MRFRTKPPAWYGVLIGTLLLAAQALTAAPALSQILSRGSTDRPVQVLHGKGEFAAKLNGAVVPPGKGWKPVTDREKLVQIMVPEKWKVVNAPDDEDAILRAMPPGDDNNPKALLIVQFATPRDADPLEVDEAFAKSYVEDLAQEPALAQREFKATDRGYVLSRGLRFALAGGTMVARKKETFQQQQLIHIGEDRIVTLQFTAQAQEFPRYADDLARIFASYQNLGARKAIE